MDWDLWSVPYDPDVIEEDALKEKCCIQVLKILITKAESEIDELEQDLVFLQSELAWIENEEWSEIGYNALTAKIHSLDTSMKSLRNDDVDDVEVHLLMHTQPVERLHEILQALLGDYFCKKDLQPASAGLLDSSFHPLKLEVGFSPEGMKSNSSCPISIQKGKGIKSEFNSEEQAEMLNLSSYSAYKERRHTENLELQATSVGVTGNNAISDYTSNTMKISGGSDSSIASVEFEEHSSIFTAELISGSSVQPMVIRTDPGEKDVDFVEDDAAEELKRSNELNESENANPDLCISSVLDYPEGLSDIPWNGMKTPKEELFDFIVNEADKPTVEELEAISQNSSERAEGNDTNPLQIVKVEAALSEKENLALTLLQPKEEVQTMPLFHQVGVTTKMILDSSSSFLTKGKKRQKPGSNPKLKAIKKRENGDEKLKKTRISEDGSEKTGDDSEVVEGIPCYSELEDMRLPELRKVAKAQKVSGYSQLKKKELIQKLACRNGGN